MNIFPRTRATLRRAFQSTVGAFMADAGLGIIGSPSPDSDYWYHSLGYRSAAGPNVNPATATRLSAVFGCTRVCAETWGSLPVSIFRERKSGTREVAVDHPANELFVTPNIWQTGFDFFEMMGWHLELRGNAYAIKVSGNGRAIDQLIPVHPDRVKVFLLPDNRLRYEVTDYATGKVTRYAMEEILHIRAWSFDGVMGVSTVSAGAEVLGVGLAQQEHRARYFRNNTVIGIAVEGPKMSPEAEDTMRDSLSEGYTGENAFKAMIVPPGRTVKNIGLTNKDSQLIEASAATRLEVCAMWRVPPHKIGDLSRGTFSNIEQQNIEFATDCIRPRVERVERRLNRDIVGSLNYLESVSGEYYAVFNMDALFRGDMKSRYDAYQAGIQAGWLSRNEARRREGLNPVDGLDEMLQAVNMETVEQAERRSQALVKVSNAAATANSAQNIDEDDSEGNSETPGEDPNVVGGKKALDGQVLHLALDASARMVRRELKGVRKLAGRLAANEAEFKAALLDFYRDLAPVIADSLKLPAVQAWDYCDGHFDKLSVSEDALLTIASLEENAALDLAKMILARTLPAPKEAA